jgi:hypothetical protein
LPGEMQDVVAYLKTPVVPDFAGLQRHFCFGPGAGSPIISHCGGHSCIDLASDVLPIWRNVNYVNLRSRRGGKAHRPEDVALAFGWPPTPRPEATSL